MLARELQVTSASVKWLGAFVLAGAAILGAGVLFAISWTPQAGRVAAWIDRVGGALRRIRLLQIPLIVLISMVFPYCVIWLAPNVLAPYFLRLVLFWILTGAAGMLLIARRPELPWPLGLAAAGLLLGVVHRAAVFLPDISTYPFSLSWSEASRYYYASLFFSEKIYGQTFPPSVLHPTRYLLQSLPFVIGGLPLWFHRLWQVLLWIGLNALAAGALVKRLRPAADDLPWRLFGWMAGGWVFLFLFQGPVWYHLVVMLILVWGGFNSRRPVRSLIVILAASIWAGMSRINWIPLPAAMGCLIYFLEIPQAGRGWLRYLGLPAIWSAGGVAAGFLAQRGYAIWSGNDLKLFASSLTSDLLWYRLLPNSTFPLGVLPAILIASFPILVLIGKQFRAGPAELSPIRWMGSAGILILFLGGGLLVSAKIGGGSNLHNLDAYLALLAVFGGAHYFDRILIEPGSSQAAGNIPAWLPTLAVLIPIAFALQVGVPGEYPDRQEAESELRELREIVEFTSAQGGQVLFIAERHLLTFGYVQDIPLVEPYEKVFLMEMAMARNLDYLNRFKEDLSSGRYSLIVAEPVNVNLQGREDEFGEENNLWDKDISIPLLCYFVEYQNFPEIRVQVLTPKINPGPCPSWISP